MKQCIPLMAVMAAAAFVVAAEPFRQATVTDVVNDVSIIRPGASPVPAAINQTFKGSETLRTGKQSRAELKFPDKTVARVGANSVFSFKSQTRDIELKQGSVLFHSESGRGGGTVRTAAATAAVTGTTIIVAATSNGGFKLMVLEGKGRVEMPNGAVRNLQPGQMSFIMPGQNGAPPVIFFDLGAAVQGSQLLNGFDNPVSSQEKIDNAIQRQEKMVSEGKLEKTDKLIGDVSEGNVVTIVDFSSLEIKFDEQRVFGPVYAAFDQDLTITGSTIDPSRVFNFTALLVNAGIITSFDIEQEGIPPLAAIVPGRNITFRTDFLDLSSFSSFDNFGFMASGNISFQQSMDVSGFYGGLGFAAAGDIEFASGISVDFEFADVFMSASGNIILDSNTLSTFGSLELTADGVLALFDSTLESPDIYLVGGDIYAQNLSATAASGIQMFSWNGDITLDYSSLQAPDYLFLTSANNITINEGYIESNFISLYAADTISLNGVVFQSPDQLITSMSAYTIVVQNTYFPFDSVNYMSSGNPNPNGDPNFNSVAPGRVNFIGSNYYGEIFVDANNWSNFKGNFPNAFIINQ